MPPLSGKNDVDLERRVFEYLSTKRMPGLHQLQVQAHGGTVTVQGRVRTFYEKQLCQQICRRVAGVIKVINQVAVADSAVEAVAS